MIIIEIRSIDSVLKFSDIYLSDINSVVVFDYKKLLHFLNLFFNSNGNLFIGNMRIDNKTAYVINLLDYDSISSQLSLKKGTILYEYIIDDIVEKVEETDIKEQIEHNLEQLINKAIANRNIDFDFDFDIDLSKIISNYISINMELSIDVYIDIITILIENLKLKNQRKKIIILLNEKIFESKLDCLNDVIIIKFYSRSFPNLLISNDIINIDKDLLCNQLKLNWPCDINNKQIESFLNDFFNNDFISNTIITDNYYNYIANIIITKILNLNIKCSYSKNLDSLPQLYIEFLNSLK